jgi:hypothetical protein
MLCECEAAAVTLIQHGLWPATPTESPPTAYSLDFMKWIKYLMLECQVSLHGFCQAVRWKNNLSKIEVSINDKFTNLNRYTCILQSSINQKNFCS